MGMLRQDKQLYEFGPFRLDASERLLTRAGTPVQLPPKVFDTLLVLVERSGHILEKDEFIKILWPDTFVEEGSLTRNISYLRKALGEGEAGQSYIETIPRRGYRFIAPVKAVLANGDAPHLKVEEEHKPEPEFSVAKVEPNGTGAFTNGYRQEIEASLLVGQHLPVQTNTLIVTKSRTWKKPLSLASALLFVTLISAAFLFFKVIASRLGDNSALSPARLQLTRLTNTGQSRFPALSPNGKYLAHVLDDGKQQSLVVRQVENSSSLPIIPPAEVNYRGLTFSHDNSYIYYVIYEGARTMGVLYQIPLLGGVAKRVLNDVDSPITLSPDGRRLAFVRNYPNSGETSLIVANADGSGERRVATRVWPTPFSLTGLAWSPDGKQIASVVRTVNECLASMDIMAVDVQDGRQTPLTKQIPGRRWVTIGQVCWLRDGSGLLAVAWREPTYTFSDQLWLIPTRAGEPRQITNDSNSYTGISASADGRTLVTTQFTRVSNIYVAPIGKIERAQPIAPGLIGHASLYLGLSWTPDGKIVYSSTANGHSDLWLMDADGSNRRQLTDDPFADLQPTVSPNGEALIFVSWRGGNQGLWRMQTANGSLRQLTSGASESSHAFSPDGKWIVYDALTKAVPSIWKIASGGGAAVQLTDFYSYQPVVSPDGQWLACYYLEPQSARVKIALIPFGAEQPAKSPARVFDNLPPQGRMLRWAPDSRALVFSSTQRGVSNLWRLPLDDGPAQRITNFADDRIFSFAWSQNGERLAYERGRVLSDTVLLTAR
jgi:Tol biopolymer transport system component/DNA-binding winged helix-turn-helix (wHTH) protein